ncbi:hypothetical protein PQR02_39010 [Paraburkholderia sediminicola]|uniref:Uncharacterized protein n=1 Tax=Paraburkholderia rhynchosiae TaxID=487049 RepID=A0ACC7NP79_9BURK
MMIFQWAVGFHPRVLRAAKVDLIALKTTLGLPRLSENPNKDKTLFQSTQEWPSGRTFSVSESPTESNG